MKTAPRPYRWAISDVEEAITVAWNTGCEMLDAEQTLVDESLCELLNTYRRFICWLPAMACYQVRMTANTDQLIHTWRETMVEVRYPPQIFEPPYTSSMPIPLDAAHSNHYASLLIRLIDCRPHPEVGLAEKRRSKDLKM